MRGHDRQLIRLGHYPSVSLQDARTEAKRLLASAQPTSGRVTFGEAYETFKKTHIALKKPSTQRGYKHILERHYLPVLQNKRMSSITAHMLSAITDELVDTRASCIMRRRYLARSFAGPSAGSTSPLTPLRGCSWQSRSAANVS